MIDSLINLYENENTINSKYHQVFYTLQKNDVQSAENLFDTIPDLFYLTAYQQAYHQAMEDYIDYLANIIQNEENIIAPDSAQVEILEELASLESSMPSVYARNILLACGKIDYSEPIYLPNLNKSSFQSDQDFQHTIKNDFSQSLKVYPSPANDFVIVEFSLSTLDGKIVIHDVTGKDVRVFKLNNQRDQIIVNVSDLKPGFYFVSLYSGSHPIASSKLTIK